MTLVRWKLRKKEDATRILKALANVSKNADKAADKAAERFVKDTKRLIIRGIREQTFAVAGHSKLYAAKKARMGLNMGVLIATAGYTRAFRTKRIRKGEWGIYLTGNAPITGVPYATVSRWAENGNKTQPPRPHIKPALSKARKTIGKKAARIIIRELLGS